MTGLTHLQRLEAESIDIMREAVSEAEKPVMLYSIGKDSSVMLHVATKAFYPSKPPFPLLHVDTTWKFREMYEFRDLRARQLGMELIVYANLEALRLDINPFTHGSAVHTDIWKTQGLRQALDKHGWARGHNSLPIVTFDEDGSTDSSFGDPDATGIDRIATIIYGPVGRVIPGLYDERIDHLNVLSTILDRYALLDQFKRDFLRTQSGLETRQEYANLRPVKDVFGEGPRLAPLPMIGK